MPRGILVLVMIAILTGCLKKQTRAPLDIDRPIPPLPSPIAKGQPPKPPVPISTPQDPTDYPAVLPKLSEPDEVRLAALDDERKTLRERIRERREKREGQVEPVKPQTEPKIEPKNEPKLPSPFVKPMSPSTLPPETIPATPGAKSEKTESDVVAAKKLYLAAKARYDAVSDYEARLVRREGVGGKEGGTEEIQFQFRKPFAVYMKNIGEVGRGREVLYVDGQFKGEMHVVTGEGDNRLIGAGFKTSMKPDNPMATSKSRHRITEAGNGNTLAKLSKAIDAAERGRPGLKVLHGVSRKESPTPFEVIEVTTQAGDEPSLPKGGVWTVYFDQHADSPSKDWPVLFTVHENGREVEYYHFSNLKAPAGLKDSDFTPDRLHSRRK